MAVCSDLWLLAMLCPCCTSPGAARAFAPLGFTHACLLVCARRFYFVSNPVLLLMLSQGSDPLAVQAYYEKIFDSITMVRVCVVL